MGRRLRTEEIRRKRAAARADLRAQRIGSEVMARVPCSHASHHTSCPVYVVTNVKGSLVHVSSGCTRKPPTDEEIAVMQGLLGPNEYQSCRDVVRTIKDALVARSWDEQRTVGANLNALGISSDYGANVVLYHAIESVREVADDRRRRDEPLKDPAAVLQKQIEGRTLTRLVDGLVLPSGWRVVPDVYRRIDRKPIIRVRFHSHEWGESFHVATYRRGGRFVLHTHEMNALARSYSSNAPRNGRGKKACSVCGKWVSSLSGHVKTERHRAAVELAVMDALAVIGARLRRKDWRERVSACASR